MRIGEVAVKNLTHNINRMKKLLLLATIVFITSCSNSSNHSTSSLEEEQVSCSQCGGSGYYYGEVCQKCSGLGYYNYRYQSGETPTFTGSGHRCRARGCECPISRGELDNAGLNSCGCGHSTQWHF